MGKEKEKLVFFDEAEHKYTDKDGNRLISGTQLIHHFSNPFDPDGEITRKYALKHGKTVEEVIADWTQINRISCEYGTAVHLELEWFINTGEIRESEHKHIVVQFSEIPFIGRLFSEVMVYSMEDMIAGTVDIIEKLPNNTINILDFKTNKELKKTDFWGNTMLHGLWYLPDCNFSHYQLQLSMYAYMCELKGLKIGKLTVLYIHPKKKIIEHHECRYMREEVILMFKKRKEFVV